MSFRATLVRAGAKRWKAIVLGLGQADRRVWSEVKPCSGPAADGDRPVPDRAPAWPRALRLEVPGPIVVFMRRGIANATVVGTVPSSSLRTLGDGATLVVSLETAQRWFGGPGQVDRVRVFADTAAHRNALKPEIAKALPARLVVQEPVLQGQSADEIVGSSEMANPVRGAGLGDGHVHYLEHPADELQRAALAILGDAGHRRDIAADRPAGGRRGAVVRVPRGAVGHPRRSGPGHRAQPRDGAAAPDARHRQSADVLAGTEGDPLRGMRGTGRGAGGGLDGFAPVETSLPRWLELRGSSRSAWIGIPFTC